MSREHIKAMTLIDPGDSGPESALERLILFGTDGEPLLLGKSEDGRSIDDIADQVAPGPGGTGQLALVRSDGTVRYFDPPEIIADAWGFKSSASWSVNTQALINAIQAAQAKASVGGAGAAKVKIAAGAFNTVGGFSDGGNNIEIEGAGAGRTFLQVPADQTPTDDFLTLNGTRSSVKELTIDGGWRGATDGVVLNGGYTRVRSVDIYKFGRNGITLGKTGSAANGCGLHDLRIRYCKGYGIQTVNNGGCHDGRFSDIDLGYNGKSAVRLDSGGHNLVNVHAWGSGCYSDLDGTDSAGFFLNSGENNLANCESETNNSYGVQDLGIGNTFVGGSLWGNYLSAYNTTNGTTFRPQLIGARIYNNNVKNTAGAGGAANAAIRNTCAYMTVVGCSIYDSAAAVPAGTYPGFTPTFPFPGRSAVKTQQYGYAGSSEDYATVVGNTMRGQDTRSGAGYFVTSSRGVFKNNVVGSNAALPTVASAATIIPPVDSLNGMLAVTGTTNITAITDTPGATTIVSSPPGTTLILRAISGLTVVNGNNLSLGANRVLAAGGILALVSDGTNWYPTN